MGKKDKAGKRDRSVADVSAKIEPQDVRDVVEAAPPVPADMQQTEYPDPDLGAALTEPVALKTWPTGQFELIANLNEIEPQLRSFFERERDIDLTYSSTPPDEQTQKVLHEVRERRVRQEDEATLAAVAATPEDYEPVAEGLLPKPTRAVAAPAASAVPAAAKAAAAPAGDSLDNLLANAQDSANHTGQPVVVSAPKRYTTKTYGKTLAKNAATANPALNITATTSAFEDSSQKFRFDFTVSPSDAAVGAVAGEALPEALGREGDAITDPAAKKAKKAKDERSAVAPSLPSAEPASAKGKKGKKGKGKK